MKKITAQQILESVEGRCLQGALDTEITAVSTDTRLAMDGAVFFALVGESFDANEFLDRAEKQKASVIICNKSYQSDNAKLVVIQVEDTLLALQRFAAWYRKNLSIDVVGITGSNGKTSTKDFTKAVLSAAFNVSATKGNFNNHIGLPLTILSAEEADQAAVWEMGMNHPGEIAPLCRIACLLYTSPSPRDA